MMIDCDTETITDSNDEIIPIAYVVNIAEPVECFEDHVVFSPHHYQDVRNRQSHEMSFLLRRIALKSVLVALLLLSLYGYFIFIM